jgi:hypothetical protein
MPAQRKSDPPRSPIPGVIPEPVRIESNTGAAEPPAHTDPGREARRRTRDERRDPSAERQGVMIPNRRKRLPLEGPLMRLVASAGIVGIAVAIAAIMGSQGSQEWLIGLVVSVVSLVLAAVLWSSRRL